MEAVSYTHLGSVGLPAAGTRPTLRRALAPRLAAMAKTRVLNVRFAFPIPSIRGTRALLADLRRQPARLGTRASGRAFASRESPGGAPKLRGLRHATG